MTGLPDPPPYMSIENVPDAVGKFRGIGGSLLLGEENFTASADTAAGGRALSEALRGLEDDPIRDRLTTVARLEQIYNDAAQCQWRNLAVDHLPNPKGVRNPKAKCRPIVRFSLINGMIDSVDYRR